MKNYIERYAARSVAVPTRQQKSFLMSCTNADGINAAMTFISWFVLLILKLAVTLEKCIFCQI